MNKCEQGKTASRVGVVFGLKVLDVSHIECFLMVYNKVNDNYASIGCSNHPRPLNQKPFRKVSSRSSRERFGVICYQALLFVYGEAVYPLSVAKLVFQGSERQILR